MSESERAQILLEVTSAVVSNLGLRDLLLAVSGCLKKFFNHDFASLVLCEEEAGMLRVHALDAAVPGEVLGVGTPMPMEGTPPGLAIRTRQTVLRERVDLDEFYSPQMRMAYEAGLRSGCSVPLISHERVLGTLNVASLREAAFTREDAELLKQIAGQVAVAVENALNFERATKESARVSTLLEVNNAIAANLNIRDLLRATSVCLHAYFKHDFAALALYDEQTDSLHVHAFDRARPDTDIYEGEPVPVEGTLTGLAFTTRRAVYRSPIDAEETHAPMARRFFEQQGLQTFCCAPLISHGRIVGVLALGSRQVDAMTPEDVELYARIAGQVAIGVENSLNFERAQKESERSRLLLEINNAVVSHLDMKQLVTAVSAALRDLMPHDAAGIALYEPQHDHLLEYSNVSYGELDVFREGDIIPIEGTPAGEVFRTGRPMLIRRPDPAAYPQDRYSRQPGEGSPKSACLALLTAHGRKLGIAGVSSTQEERFTEDDLELFTQLTGQIAIAVENALNFEHARAAEQEVKRKLERERLMLEINNAVVAQLSLRELVREVSSCLRDVLQPDVTGISLYDPETDQFRAYFFDMPEGLPPVEEGTMMPTEGTAGGVAFHTGKPFFLNSPAPEMPMHEFDRRLIEGGIRSGGVVPLIAHDRKLGFLGVGSFRENAFSEEDQELLGHIANQIAIAVENALNFEHAQKERERAETLLSVNNAITTSLDLRELLRETSDCLRRYFKHDLAGMALYDAESDQLRVHALDLAQPAAQYVDEGFLMPLEGSPAGLAFTTRRTVLVPRLADWEPSTPVVERALARGIRSSCNAPLVFRDRPLGAVVVASRREDAFSESDAELLGHIASQFAIAVENALQFGEIEGLKNKLASEKLYLEEEIKAEYNFGEIIGQSRALRAVLEQLKTVAPTDSVVLICGETGTGKELIARAIHDLSARRERTMVKVNCAAIPTGLLESEFFGHEKGAFTGAVTQRAGRFELANKGTLFLDEVGEIPLELQPKLLRVLQEQEFERLGGSKTIKVDVRLIAATNCNLREMVAEKKFRGDLFYRLNVFPIFLPPLRERAGDIPLLAGYFAQKHSRRMNKRVDAIPSETVEALCRYHWPGNVRELENFIERACILTRGHELQAPLTELEGTAPAGGEGGPAPSAAAPAELLSLADAERAHIEEVLRHTKGVVGGRGGAAEILGLPISTLRGRMKKLGLM